MLRISLLTVSLLLGATAAADPPVEDSPRPTEAGKSVDYNADAPPPASWENETPSAPADEDGAAPAQDPEGRTLMQQTVYTLMMLLVVVGLIYLLAKFGLSRLSFLRPSTGSKLLTIVDRAQLDARNALYVVDIVHVGRARRMVIGAGDKGIALLGEFDVPADQQPTRAAKRFGDLLQKSGGIAAGRTADEPNSGDL